MDAIINACDAGREGELIFRYIIQYAGVKKPIQRLWLQSMTQAAIRDAFANLRDDVQLKPLEAAALARRGRLAGRHQRHARHDRLQQQDGGFFKTPVGRVRTPTLAIVAEREERIRAFVPRDYWEVRAQFGRRRPVRRPLDRPGLQEGRARPGKARIAPVVASRRPERGGGLPRTARQRDRGIQALDPDVAGPVRPDLAAARANGRFGSAKTTLALAQTLYERHKALTYRVPTRATCPRTT